MANYSTLKAAVADVVKTNGTKAITGANLQAVLLSIINSVGGGGYIFKGVATPSTSAGTPDQNVFYIGGAGTYANFGTSVVVPPTNIAVFKYNGTWNCEQLTVENGGVFDISAFKAGGGTLATYADLAAALGTNGANVPQSLRKGGMSVKFVCSSDNKYIQEVYASIGLWDPNTGAIQTTGTLIRANLKIAAIGQKSISVTIPSGYYVNFYYVNADNVKVAAILESWQGVDTVNLELNGLYDLMLNIKYGTAGNTDITATMLASAPFLVTNNYDRYVQYRLMATTWSTNVDNWQGVDDEPTAGSNNLVKSEGVDKRLMSSKINGNGDSFISSTHELIKGHTYLLTHLNYGWNNTYVSTYAVLFLIESFSNNQRTVLYRIEKRPNHFVAREYQFTVPLDSDYILIGGSADRGDSIFYQLEDITNTIALKNNWGEIKIDAPELIVEPGTINSNGGVVNSPYAARGSVFINIKETNVVKSINFKITSLFGSLISEFTDADTLAINVVYYNENKQFISRLADRVRLSLSNPEGKYPLLDGTVYIKLLFYPLNGTTNIDMSSIDPSRQKVYELITNGIDISYNNFYSIEKTEVSATTIENTDVDTSGTLQQIDNSIRYRYVYNNCIQKGDIINIKAKTGYKIAVDCFLGELHFDNTTNSWVGQKYFDTGWQQALSLKVMNDAVNSITINTRKDDNAIITHYDIIENIEICVFRGGESKGTYSYSGKKIKIDTTPTFDGINYMNISYSGGSGQGAAIYGDYFIQGGDGGHIKIFDLKEKTTVANDITLGSAGTGNHCNNISIGVERANDGVFPYIYISECNSNTRRCFVENLTLEDSTLVQTIVYSGTKYLNNTADHDWVVDRENELLYAVGNTKSSYTVSGNMIGITKFRLPKIFEGSNVTLTDSDVLDYFELDGSIGKFYVYQGTLIYNGKLFFAIGGNATSHRFAVINLANHEVETIVELDEMYAAGEPEAINIYKNCIFISYPNQGKLYILTFN